MSFTENDLLQLSALQHFIFCERQCALIHIEQMWSENLFTAEGRIMHEKVDTADRETRGNVRIEYGVPLCSFRLGLIGKADVVEFHREGDKWLPYPVEYKRGKPKTDDCDKVQLCAQALCLEEILNVNIPEGSLFYGKIRRRQEVDFNEELRNKTEETARRLHALISSGKTPQANFEKKCNSCSLKNLCMPTVTGAGKNVKRYLTRVTAE